MRRLAFLLLCVPVVVLAQTPTPSPKPAAPTARPTTPAPRATTPAPRPTAPATRKPTAVATPARPPAAPAAPAPLTEEQKVIYALGLLMQQSLGQFDLSVTELDIIKRALTDAAAGKPAIDLDEFGPQIQPLATARRERVMAREKEASTAYLATAAAETGAVKTTSGLIYRELLAGTGASPTASDFVRVHYRGTLVNGTEFDSSYSRNEPAEFALRGVIGCWTEGVQRMRVGGKARLVCPADLAYGDTGTPNIPGGATIIFDIELLGIIALR
jgi:FKBP-type peptidyl-prolyl cis-trans isomerase FkpA